MPIRAITFDFWRTLFRDNQYKERQDIRLDAFVDATGCAREDVEEAFSETWREFFRHHIEEQRTLCPQDAVDLTARTLEVAMDADTTAQLTHVFGTAILEHPPEPIDGALDAVRAAAQRVPVGIISDSGISPGTSLRKLLERNGFMPHFSAMVFSDEIEVAKPQARMFETAAQGLGVAPEELLHIGDLEPTDIVGARRVNAQAALFAGDNDRFLGATTADHTFTSWDEFVAALPDLVDS